MFKKLVLSSILALSLVSLSFAWQNCTTGVLITETTRFDSQSFSIISADNGNTIIVWQDGRGDYWNTFAQKLNSTGSTLWTEGGVAISTSAGDQFYPVLTGDGAGGAIITWFDGRYVSSDDAEIFAQRVDTNGNVLWTTNGVAICTAVNDQSNPVITTDGTGGAIISWHDKRNGDYDIYAQRINSTGSTLWTEGGVPVCNETATQWWPTITSDSANGAIITWYDYRNISTSSTDIYAQRIDGNGNPLWTANGIAICTAANDQSSPQVTSDGANGAILCWPDNRSGNYDVYTQRVNSTGLTLWTENGVAICTAANDQPSPVIASDGENGAIIAWGDQRGDGFMNHIYIQRINSLGTTLWTENGYAICTAGAGQNTPVIISDGTGGAIVTWWDQRYGNLDVYAQKVDHNGNPLWDTDGAAIMVGDTYQFYPTLTSDQNGGAVIVWLDTPNGVFPYQIDAQQIGDNGMVPVELSQFEIE